MISFNGLPSLDLDNGFLRAWWFEPLLATISFAVFINWYWYHERIRGLSTTSTFKETVSFGNGPIFSSAIAYWVGIYVWKVIVPPASQEIPDGIPTNLDELVYLLSEMISGIVLYDSIFFVIHWAMHAVPFLRGWHRRHHQSGSVESRDVLNHSLIDGALQVLVNILVQRQTAWGLPKSRLARCLHNVIVTWMLTESHSASPYPNVWRRWFVGVREHRNHHLGFDHRYQQFFGHLDGLRAAWTSSSLSSFGFGSWPISVGGKPVSNPKVHPSLCNGASL